MASRYKRQPKAEYTCAIDNVFFEVDTGNIGESIYGKAEGAFRHLRSEHNARFAIAVSTIKSRRKALRFSDLPFVTPIYIQLL